LRFSQFEQSVGVIGAGGDRFFEYGGVGGDTAQAVVVDQALQFAARDQAAGNLVHHTD
jgi:hypothetical protein